MISSVNIKLLLILTLTFILFTPIGTVSHEYGHIIVAKYYGYETQLHYGSMDFDKSELKDDLIISDTSKLNSDNLFITLGGIFQTIFTGTIGLLILLYRKELIHKNGLQFIDWFAVFLSMFWLREIFNLVLSFTGEVVNPDGTWFGGDELIVSQGLNLWIGTVPLILASAAMIVASYVIFIVLPKKIRLIFILSGLIGGVLGFVLWMKFIGPIVLP